MRHIRSYFSHLTSAKIMFLKLKTNCKGIVASLQKLLVLQYIAYMYVYRVFP